MGDHFLGAFFAGGILLMNNTIIFKLSDIIFRRRIVLTALAGMFLLLLGAPRRWDEVFEDWREVLVLDVDAVGSFVFRRHHRIVLIGRRLEHIYFLLVKRTFRRCHQR